jgi:hypothetical protein
MVKTWGRKSRLAAELGISPAAVTKMAKRGMPIDDADAARRWRLANLERGRMRPDPGPSADTLLRRAQALADLAVAALDRHQLDLVANDLRMAMHLVPLSHRPQLVLRFDLWAALIGPLAMSAMTAGRDEPDAPDAPAAPGAPAALDDSAEDDPLDPGAVAYSLACGEAFIR